MQEIMRGHLSGGGMYGGEVTTPGIVPEGILDESGD
jgi:hypothetical protein